LIWVKKVDAKWEKEKEKEYQKDLKDVEVAIHDIFDKNTNGIFNNEDVEWLK